MTKEKTDREYVEELCAQLDDLLCNYRGARATFEEARKRLYPMAEQSDLYQRLQHLKSREASTADRAEHALQRDVERMLDEAHWRKMGDKILEPSEGDRIVMALWLIGRKLGVWPAL